MSESEMTEKGGLDLKVTVRHGVTEEPVSFTPYFGDNIREAIELFGEDTVFEHFSIGGKTSARNRLYNLVHRGEKSFSAAEAVTEMGSWKLGRVAERVAVDPMAALRKRMIGMTKEQKLALFEELQGMIS